jgi:hypothetical protein
VRTLTPRAFCLGLLLGVLVGTAAGASEGTAAFERLKKLEGNWRAKDGQTVSLRLVGSGVAVLEQVGAGADRALASVVVYRLEGAELVAAQDGEGHSRLRLVPGAGNADALRFEARLEAGQGGLVSVTLGTRDAGTLRRVVVTRAQGKDTTRVTEYTREYLDTLK